MADAQPEEPLPPQAPNPLTVPDELLSSIFEFVTTSTHMSSAYRNLLNFQLVCKQWNRVASPVLPEYSLVEIATSEDAAALQSTLASSVSNIPAAQVRALAVGIAMHQEGTITHSQLFSLLETTPEIRQLVILDGDEFTDMAFPQIPTNQSRLQKLLDVTIMSISTIEATTTASSILCRLAHHIKFLQLPGAHVPSLQALSQNPAFQLVSLTIQAYPSSMAEWVLASSEESLQSLTVAEVTSVAKLAEKHPNLRSLRILDHSNAPLDVEHFQDLRHLERLEIRHDKFPWHTISLFPDTIVYLRFRSTELADRLQLSLNQVRWWKEPQVLPRLQLVVWDMDGAPDWAWNADWEKSVLERLQETCRYFRIELRIFPRTSAGGRATMVRLTPLSSCDAM